MPQPAIATQVHGYQQGHQLLSSSIKLEKQDQIIIDRLSDVAGPLRPGELFEPYLSAYPLPSAKFFVLARTWQDLTVPRAGCVRTLSLLIPVDSWSHAEGLGAFLDLLDPETFPSQAVLLALPSISSTPLPPVPEFRGSELLEALFLEEAKPVALFDAPTPELIAIRLLTALWPAMRRRFAVSTFALSPRKIEGRSFDLIFAPKDARSRFTDWGGRRVDARGTTSARHRWTNAIVNRVFDAPIPSLLDEQELRLIGSEEADKPAALRIAFLWDELTAKVGQSPSAALGLLDIANSRKDGDPATLSALQPILTQATERAANTMPANQAWEFVSAITRKMRHFPRAATLSSVAHAATQLANKSPDGAITLLSQADPEDALSSLIPSIAKGVGRDFSEKAQSALLQAKPEILTSLIAANNDLLMAVTHSPILIAHLGEILPSLALPALENARLALLPQLVEDFQASAAAPLIASLDLDGLVEEVRLLSKANNFAAERLVAFVVARARELGTIESIRSVLLAIDPSPQRDNFLEETFSADRHDLRWLLEDGRVPQLFVGETLSAVLRRATADQLRSAFTDEGLVDAIVQSLPNDASEILWRAVKEVDMPLAFQLRIATRILPEERFPDRSDLASRMLDQMLQVQFEGDEIGTIAMLLGVLGDELDGSWVLRQGAGRHLATAIVARNLMSFDKAPPAARRKILQMVHQLSNELAERYTLELDAGALAAVTHLFSDSQRMDEGNFLSASARILPVLLRSRYAPVSPLIAITFPPVYHELAKEDDGPDFLRFIPFVDWDRCKSARRELVDAFLAARSWDPSDLALVACHSGDRWKILRKVAKSYGGDRYFDRMAEGLANLPEPCASQIRATMSEIYADWPSKYDWRD